MIIIKSSSTYITIEMYVSSLRMLYISAMLIAQGVPVEFEFVRVCEELLRKKTGIEVLYGKPMRAGNAPEDLGRLGVEPDLRNRRAHPILLLKEHVLVNDFSLFDRLRELDTESKLAVTRDQLDSVLKVRYCYLQMQYFIYG